MQIDQMELRNKISGFTIKKSSFGKVNCLNAENTEDAQAILNALQSMRNFALGWDLNTYVDNISRLRFHAAHKEYLWFAKTTSQEGEIISCNNPLKGMVNVVDEEELYNEENNIILTRDFSHLTVDGYEQLPPISDKKSMLCILATPEVTQIYNSFCHIYSYYLHAQDADTIVDEIAALPHGAVVLLDASKLKSAYDLSTLIQKREDLQIFAVNCVGGNEVIVTRKGNILSCK